MVRRNVFGANHLYEDGSVTWIDEDAAVPWEASTSAGGNRVVRALRRP